jgi:hypothetical protein
MLKNYKELKVWQKSAATSKTGGMRMQYLARLPAGANNLVNPVDPV